MKFQNKYKKQLLPAVISLSILPLYAGGAIAQQESASLEEIVVTARKRQESIQDVPVAVSALSPGQLERGSITSSLELGKMVPNVELHETAIGSESLSASIRGMSYDDIEKSIEPTVGVAIDGVFLASNSGGVFDLFDVDSVEVLRGPQGTLFGRNTIGGVISVQRTEPTGEFGAKLEATAGDEDMTDIKGVINMPLGDNGGIKLSFKSLESDSHVYNTSLNARRPMKDSETMSIAVKYNFSENTSAVLTFDDYDHNTTAPDNVFVGFEALGNQGAINSEANDWKTSPQFLPLTATLEGENTTLKVTHDTDNFQIKYIMGIMDYDEVVREASWGLGPDVLGGVFFPVDRDQNFKQTSHELQLTSDLDGPMNFVAGLYSMEADSYITSGPIQNFTALHYLDSTAVFGEMSYEINDLWSFTLGARYTEEEKELDTRSYPMVSGNAARLANSYVAADLLNSANPTFKDNNTSFRVVLQREIETGMVYASYSTGYRSGGFFNRGITPLENLPFKSEEVASIELGMRSNPTDNSQINITYFNSEYTDKQTTVIVPASDADCDKEQNDAGSVTCSFVRNAGEVSMSGIEFEGTYMPTDALTLRASFGTLDADYDEYNYNGVDISDKARLLYAPDLTAYLGAEHTSDRAGGTLTINVGFSHKDEVETQADWSTYDPVTGPEVTIESFETLDISATFMKELSNGTLKLRVYGTDVLEDGNRVGRRYDAGSFAWAELVPRRQMGVTVGYEF
jgi:iron complex outermembrane receptor protein